MSWTDLAEQKAALRSICEFKVDSKTNTTYGLDCKGNTISERYDADGNGISEYSIFNYAQNKRLERYYDNESGDLSQIFKYTGDDLTQVIEYYYGEDENFTAADVTDNYK